MHKALDMKRSVSIPPHSPHTPQFLACEKSRIRASRAIAFAIDQPDDVGVNEIIVRPTASPY
ncbi:MAG: hypothetical protein V7K67_20460 [Nostoc sp.]